MLVYVCRYGSDDKAWRSSFPNRSRVQSDDMSLAEREKTVDQP